MKKFGQAMLILGLCLLMMVFQSYAIMNRCARVKALQAYEPVAERQANDQTKHAAAVQSLVQAARFSFSRLPR